MTNEAAQFMQIALGVIAVGGIGGVWFRLGSLTATTTDLQRRVIILETVTR